MEKTNVIFVDFKNKKKVTTQQTNCFECGVLMEDSGYMVCEDCSLGHVQQDEVE